MSQIKVQVSCAKRSHVLTVSVNHNGQSSSFVYEVPPTLRKITTNPIWNPLLTLLAGITKAYVVMQTDPAMNVECLEQAFVIGHISRPPNRAGAYVAAQLTDAINVPRAADRNNIITFAFGEVPTITDGWVLTPVFCLDDPETRQLMAPQDMAEPVMHLVRSFIVQLEQNLPAA